MAETHPRPHAIVFSYPYQGHITPTLDLATNLASRGFTITYVQLEFVHHAISNAHDGAEDVDFFVEARQSGLDIRYTTISDGFPLEFDRNLNLNEYWEGMIRDFPDRVDELVGALTSRMRRPRPFSWLLILYTHGRLPLPRNTTL
ncbi:UNVERIFIED_CONTAM: UDP-glycosyltransferase 86A1 [Sesamum radiatum]|uniref:UDP-glycosyltransferase 86A1 n=1 Tax=Sesamum radiatum TaxID=300843 RepID=A0AAW2SIW2_SESRA